MGVDLSTVVVSSDYAGEDDAETALVGEMRQEARRFLESFAWCAAIREEYVGIAIGGVVAVMLFRIEPGKANVDEWLWVVVGDLPPVYLVTDNAPNPDEALRAYIGEMSEWVRAVREGRHLEDVIPVMTAGGGEALEPTAEHADMLDQRLRFLAANILAD